MSKRPLTTENVTDAGPTKKFRLGLDANLAEVDTLINGLLDTFKLIWGGAIKLGVKTLSRILPELKPSWLLTSS
jgi:hypothetical protein